MTSFTSEDLHSPFSCFLCGTNKEGGNRFLSRGDLNRLTELPRDDRYPLPDESIAFLASLKDGDTNEDEASTTEVSVCWSGCPAATRLFTARAQSHFDDDPPLSDSPFDLGFMMYDPAQYESIMSSKREAVINLLTNDEEEHGGGVILPGTIESIRSPVKYFRQRVRFGAFVSEDMQTMHYLMWNNEGIPCRIVDQFPIASQLVNDLLKPLKRQLLARPILLRNLSAVHFLTTLSGHALISLFYDGNKNLYIKHAY